MTRSRDFPPTVPSLPLSLSLCDSAANPDCIFPVRLRYYSALNLRIIFKAGK